jgi:recombination protein RecT
MNQELQEVKPKQQEPVALFKNQVVKNEHEFRAALPAHIPVERFTRVVMTAVVNNPDLLDADRRSLFESAMKAAQDGLLPDGREGALVIYNTKNKGRNGNGDQWIKKVQWMPMIAGILKKVRNSGELISISAYVAYANDEFSYELGDEEKIAHRPALDNRGAPRLAYAIAKLKDGGVYREIMTVADIEKVRNISRAKDSGPWVGWWDEMARKTVLRRLSKRLPMSSDLDDLIRRDDSLYDFEGARRSATDNPPRIKTLETPAERLTAELNALAAGGNGEQQPRDPPHDPETGEIIDRRATEDALAEKYLSEEAIEKTRTEIETKTQNRPVPNMENDPTGEEAGRQLKEKLDERALAQKLVDEARAMATNGAKKFKVWEGSLDTADYATLKPHLPSLRAAAAKADASGA